MNAETGAAQEKAEFFDADTYMFHVTGFPPRREVLVCPEDAPDGARLGVWRVDSDDGRHIPGPCAEGTLFSTAEISLGNSGNRTLRAPKRSGKFGLEPALCGGTRLAGMTRISLKSMYNDPSQMREALAWRLFRNAGVPSRHTYHGLPSMTVTASGPRRPGAAPISSRRTRTTPAPALMATNFYFCNSGRLGRQTTSSARPTSRSFPGIMTTAWASITSARGGSTPIFSTGRATRADTWRGHATSRIPLVQNLLRNREYRQYYLEHLLETEFRPPNDHGIDRGRVRRRPVGPHPPGGLYGIRDAHGRPCHRRQS